MGSVTITAIVPGIVTYHVYWDGRIEKHILRAIQKGYEDKYKYSYHDERDRNMKLALRVLNLQKCMKRKVGLLILSF